MPSLWLGRIRSLHLGSAYFGYYRLELGWCLGVRPLSQQGASYLCVLTSTFTLLTSNDDEKEKIGTISPFSR